MSLKMFTIKKTLQRYNKKLTYANEMFIFIKPIPLTFENYCLPHTSAQVCASRG